MRGALSSEAVRVLGSMDIDSASRLVKITTGQLPRPLYVEVNKALEALGGKWNRKKGGHVFDEDPQDALDQVVLTGRFVDRRQQFQFFETPGAVARKLIEAAGVRPGMRVLEPSAGRGAIVREVPAECPLSAIELDPKHGFALADACLKFIGKGEAEGVAGRDFLAYPPREAFDAVVMNPPFSRQQDVDHVTHALKFLRPEGCLAAVMSNGVTFRENQKAKAFRALLAANEGTVEGLPDGSFEPATSVKTVLVTMRRAG